MLNDNQVGDAALFFVIQDYAAALIISLFVISFVFLAQWHIMRRIEGLAEIFCRADCMNG
jgi:hypothetical protein